MIKLILEISEVKKDTINVNAVADKDKATEMEVLLSEHIMKIVETGLYLYNNQPNFNKIKGEKC